TKRPLANAGGTLAPNRCKRAARRRRHENRFQRREGTAEFCAQRRWVSIPQGQMGRRRGVVPRSVAEKARQQRTTKWNRLCYRMPRMWRQEGGWIALADLPHHGGAPCGPSRRKFCAGAAASVGLITLGVGCGGDQDSRIFTGQIDDPPEPPAT